VQTTIVHSALPLLQTPATLAGTSAAGRLQSTPVEILAQSSATFAELLAFPTIGFLLVALPGLALLFHFLASPAFKGWLGEKIVIHAAFRKLDPAIYRHFHDLYLPRLDGQGTTRIAHVVVSAFGVFVIDTRNYRGWITAAIAADEWTQQLYHRTTPLRNPLRQNQHNLGALRAFLGLPENRFHPMVFLMGGSGFKTPMPENVLTRGLLPWILSHEKQVLGPTALQQAVTRLEELNLSTDRKAAAHLQQLEPQATPARNAMELEYASWRPPVPSKRHLLPPAAPTLLSFRRSKQ
jgi:hypothetical protein